MKVVILAVLLALVSTAVAASNLWRPCSDFKGTVIANVTDLDIVGCTALPCVMKKGSNASVSIMFTLTDDIAAVNNAVYGVIAGIDVPFPDYPANEVSACNLGMKCPGKKGDAVTEKVSLPVSTSFPSIKVTAKWKLTDDKKVEIGCFITQLQLE